MAVRVLQLTQTFLEVISEITIINICKLILLLTFFSIFILVDTIGNYLQRTVNLICISLVLITVWILEFGLIFIFIAYIMAFIGAVMMLFLSIVLMLPVNNIKFTHVVNNCGIVLSVSGGDHPWEFFTKINFVVLVGWSIYWVVSNVSWGVLTQKIKISLNMLYLMCYKVGWYQLYSYLGQRRIPLLGNQFFGYRAVIWHIGGCDDIIYPPVPYIINRVPKEDTCGSKKKVSIIRSYLSGNKSDSVILQKKKKVIVSFNAANSDLICSKLTYRWHLLPLEKSISSTSIVYAISNDKMYFANIIRDFSRKRNWKYQKLYYRGNISISSPRRQVGVLSLMPNPAILGTIWSGNSFTVTTHFEKSALEYYLQESDFFSKTATIFRAKIKTTGGALKKMILLQNKKKSSLKALDKYHDNAFCKTSQNWSKKRIFKLLTKRYYFNSNSAFANRVVLGTVSRSKKLELWLQNFKTYILSEWVFQEVVDGKARTRNAGQRALWIWFWAPWWIKCATQFLFGFVKIIGYSLWQVVLLITRALRNIPFIALDRVCQFFVSAVIIIVLMLESITIWGNSHNKFSKNIFISQENIFEVKKLLYDKYPEFMLLTAFILLIALIGAAIVFKKTNQRNDN